jgi:two-component system response regulator YesN
MRTVCTEEEERSLIAALKSGSGESLEAWVREAIERIRADAEATPRTAAAYLQSLLVAGYRWLERAAESIGGDRPLPPWEPLSADGLIADAEGELTRRLMPLLSRYAGMAARSSPIPRAIAYIREHIGENVTLEQVAGHVHLHPNYFSEMFKRETGQNFANYVREAKMRRAQHLLSETPAKISEVARQVGYTDVKHFNRLFKQYTGMTPSEYRENI